MKKLFKAIRNKDYDSVKKMIEDNPELVNCVAKQPPKKDDGQSPLQVAIKTGNFDIANLLIDRGADINFIEGEDSYDDWRMPVLNYAILAAVMNCRYTLRMDFGDRIYEEEKSTEERADAAFGVLKRLLESGADVRKTESRGATCAWRLCKSAEDILPSYAWDTHTVSKIAIITPELEHDLGRIFLLLKEYGADFGEDDIMRYRQEENHPMNRFLDMID